MTDVGLIVSTVGVTLSLVSIAASFIMAYMRRERENAVGLSERIKRLSVLEQRADAAEQSLKQTERTISKEMPCAERRAEIIRLQEQLKALDERIKALSTQAQQ